MKCDNCGRATGSYSGVSFHESDVVLCERAGCRDAVERAKHLYYDEEVNSLREELAL